MARLEKLGRCNGSEVFSTGECNTLINTEVGFKWVPCMDIESHLADDVHRAVKQTVQVLNTLEDASRAVTLKYHEAEVHLENADKWLESAHAHIMTALERLKKQREKAKQ